LVREAFRQNRELFPKHCDIVVTIRPDFVLNSYADVRAGMVRALGG
jgi:RNase P protein component